MNEPGQGWEEGAGTAGPANQEGALALGPPVQPEIQVERVYNLGQPIFAQNLLKETSWTKRLLYKENGPYTTLLKMTRLYLY